jgi:hypothetical protein
MEIYMNDDAICELHNEDEDIFVLVDGVKIARRGRLTHDLGMLERGWIVPNVQSGNAIEVRYEGARIQ